jgi:predicted lipoprotein with Yx(FWY)xxD motif
MLKQSTRHLVGLLALLACAASFAGQPSVPLKTNAYGYSTTLDGNVVFTCTKDVPKSTTRTCHLDSDPDWTPLLATEQDVPGGLFGVVKMDDGQLHWTYRGRPVYIAAPPKDRKSPWKRPGHKAIWREH